MTHTQNFALDPQQLQKIVFFPQILDFLHLSELCNYRSSWEDHDDIVIMIMMTVWMIMDVKKITFTTLPSVQPPPLLLKVKCFKLKSYSCFVWQKIAIPRFPGGKNSNSLPRIFCPTISSERMGLNLHFNQILNYLRWTFDISGTKISRWLKF